MSKKEKLDRLTADVMRLKEQRAFLRAHMRRAYRVRTIKQASLILHNALAADDYRRGGGKKRTA